MRLAVMALAAGMAAAAFANDLTVDRRTMLVTESVTITVSVEDEFAALDDIRLPVRNLMITNRPSIAAEFSYINGSIVRRKVFRYRARGVGPGPAVIGPLVLAAGGRRDTLPPVSLQVLPDRAAASNDPAAVLRELLSTERDPFFIIAVADKERAYVGEQVVVTWWLYNGVNVQQWQIGSIPKLTDFWVEELDVRNAQPVTVFVGASAMQRMPIRRVALFPLRAGQVEVGPMQIEASLVRRTSFGGIFDRYEGSMTEISYASAPMTVDVKPLPTGAAAAAAVGDFTLRCARPLQRSGGPVTFDAVLAGRGNARAASAPQFVKPPAADVQVVDAGVVMYKNDPAPSMTRRWRYVLFPRQSGKLALPPLELPVFSPSAGAAQTLRCEAGSLSVQPPEAASDPLAAAEPSRVRRVAPLVRYFVPVVIAVMAGVVIWFAVWPWWRRRRAVRRELRELTADPAPAAIRDAVHSRLERSGLAPAELLRELTVRGEAYRALRSLLDALERDRIEVDSREREIRRRLRDLLVA